MSDHGEKDEEEELRKQTEIIRQAKTALESKSDLTPAETLSQLLTILTLWDEKFEHLESVTARVKGLEKERAEDVHSIKSEIITPYPAVKRPVPREFEVRDFQSKQDPTGEKIPIKLALEAVPFFDGYRPSVFQFLKACERAKSMLAPQQETQLTKLLMNKLRGHALIAIGDSDLITLDEFGNKLKQYFAPCKNVNQYKGELGYTFKKPGRKHSRLHNSRSKFAFSYNRRRKTKLWGNIRYTAGKYQCGHTGSFY